MTQPHPCANCAACIDARSRGDNGYPWHVVHPLTGLPIDWDANNEAVCPTCGTRWRQNDDKTLQTIE